MSANTKIEWCDHTFNPWVGCMKVGPGCDNCYAEADFDKRRGFASWGAGQPRKRTSLANWRKPLAWNRAHDAFYAEHGRRQRVFCASLADVFDNEVDPQWRRDLFDLIELTPNLDWLLLTKRIGNVARMLPSHDWAARANVWLGATICNQTEANRDIPKLLALPARVRFLSMEPLLGAVDLRFHIFSEPTGNLRTISGRRQIELRKPDDGGLHWVIVGGESGPKARPMHPAWVRNLRDQCKSFGVQFLFKQWGEWAPRSGLLTGGGTDFVALDPECKRWPEVIRLGEHGLDTQVSEHCTPDAGEDIYMQRVGKKNAGRMLDGRTWDEFPKGAA